MPYQRPYAVGAAFEIALLDAGDDPAGVAFESGPTFAAGDAKVSSDQQALTNLTAEYGTFTSGDTEPQPGDSITGVTSSETAVVIGTFLTSGSWSGGDAAGYIFVEQVSGAWQNEVVNNTTQSDADSMTLAADFTPSVGIVATGTRVFVGLTSTELTCKQATVQIADQDGPVWAADGFKVETFGNASAQLAIDLDDGDGSSLTEAGGDGDHLTAINLPNQTMDITGNLSGSVGSVTGSVGGSVASVTAGVSLANGAITDASLAGNMEIVFETDFATNYDTTNDRWKVDAVAVEGKTLQSGAGDNFNVWFYAGGIGNPAATCIAVYADTNELQTDDIPGTLSSMDGKLDTIDNFIDTEIAAIITAIGTPSDLGSGADLASNLVDIESQTDDIGAAGAGLTEIPWNANWDAEVQSEVIDALQETVPDSVPAVGTRPNMQQAVRICLQALTAKDYTGTTFTVYKEDNSTTLISGTLNDATSPTQVIRAA